MIETIKNILENASEDELESIIETLNNEIFDDTETFRSRQGVCCKPILIMIQMVFLLHCAVGRLKPFLSRLVCCLIQRKFL